MAERLRLLIESGELAPGTRLNETELCEDMGVSRTPCEKQCLLATEGLIEVQPNRGAIVGVVTEEDAGNPPHHGISEGLEADWQHTHGAGKDHTGPTNSRPNDLPLQKQRYGKILETNRLIHELISEGAVIRHS